MTKGYMDKVFWDNVDECKKQGKELGRKAPDFSKNCWQINQNDKSGQKLNQKRDFFSAEELEAFRLIDIRKGVAKNHMLDETGQVMTKEQEMVNNEVKKMMRTVGLVPLNEMQCSKTYRDSRPPKLENPHNENRQRVKYFDPP